MSTTKLITNLRESGRKRAGEFLQNDKLKILPNGRMFQDSTYLYIRSFDGDIGERSPGITDPRGDVFWLSPDITLFDPSGASVERLQLGTSYVVEVILRNDGDVTAYSCTVELYLCDPALGFSRSAPGTIALGLQHAEVVSGRTTAIRFRFVATELHAGHKCMFARVHSVVNREVPTIVSTLDPFHNRHDAQQNLMIVPEGEFMIMNLAMHEDENNIAMRVQAVKGDAHLAKELTAKGGRLGGFGPLKFLPLAKAKSAEAAFEVLPLAQKIGPAFTPATKFTKVKPERQQHLKVSLKDLPVQGAIKRTSSQWQFPMKGKGAQKTVLVPPALGLQKGEFAVFQVVTRNTKEQRTGGLTLVVKG